MLVRIKLYDLVNGDDRQMRRRLNIYDINKQSSSYDTKEGYDWEIEDDYIHISKDVYVIFYMKRNLISFSIAELEEDILTEREAMTHHLKAMSNFGFTSTEIQK